MELVNASLFLIWDIVKRVLHVFIQTEGVMKDLGLANPHPHPKVILENFN